jgi:hypothetical protein
MLARHSGVRKSASLRPPMPLVAFNVGLLEMAVGLRSVDFLTPECCQSFGIKFLI